MSEYYECDATATSHHSSAGSPSADLSLTPPTSNSSTPQAARRTSKRKLTSHYPYHQYQEYPGNQNLISLIGASDDESVGEEPDGEPEQPVPRKKPRSQRPLSTNHSPNSASSPSDSAPAVTDHPEEEEDQTAADTDLDNDHLVEEGDLGQQAIMEARILISSRDAGAIIGRGGVNITHLRQNYDASITVPDCPSPERVLTIVASVEKLGKIVREILKFVESTRATTKVFQMAPGKAPRKPMDFPTMKNGAELRLLMHTSHAGGLIGKGGVRITQLREETQAGIKIFSECCPQSTERVCLITGQVDNIATAVKAILYLIKSLPIKGIPQLYNPRNFDAFNTQRYGGYNEQQTQLQTGLPAPIQSGLASRSGNGLSGPTGTASPFYHTPPPYHHPSMSSSYHSPYPGSRLHTMNGPSSDVSSPPEFANTPFLPHWSSAVGSGRFSRGSSGDVFGGEDPTSWLSNDEFMFGTSKWNAKLNSRTLLNRNDVSIVPNADGTSTATIMVPHKIVGAIIGKGGHRIKDIRYKSKAEISIGQLKSTTNQRLITVKGYSNDVQLGVDLICKCIDENEDLLN